MFHPSDIVSLYHFLSTSAAQDQRQTGLTSFCVCLCAQALESDTRVLAYEVGRKYNVRVNSISAGPLGSRAAKAIGFIDDMIKCVVCVLCVISVCILFK